MFNVLSISHIFQFHKGTIRTGGDDKTLSINPHFNSIKVQLEPNSPNLSILPLYFNSIKVQLERRTEGSTLI